MEEALDLSSDRMLSELINAFLAKSTQQMKAVIMQISGPGIHSLNLYAINTQHMTQVNYFYQTLCPK